MKHKYLCFTYLRYVLLSLLLVLFALPTNAAGLYPEEQNIDQQLKTLGVPRPVEGNGQLSPQIVGGDPSPINARPYQVSLQRSGRHICGGALINNQWVVTAAHCIGGSLTVRVGVHNLDSSQGQVFSIAQTIVHENYSSASNGNDIALLKLNGTASSNLTPLLLPDNNIMAQAAFPGAIATVSGWGALSEGGFSPSILHEVDVPIVSNTTCNASYGGIIASMICAGLETGGKDSCQGDSGGPMVVEYNGQVYSVGIVSWGYGCARPYYYGVYTRTVSFVTWINSKIGGTTPGGELQNSVPVTGLSASQGQQLSFTLSVPAGANALSFTISGGSGDADLYVRFGTTPTTSTYDCRPYLNGNNETCTFGSIQAGTYHVMLRAYSNFSGVNLVGNYSLAPGNNMLQNGVPKTNLSAGQGQNLNYNMVVPAGANNLLFQISGGSGDADLYVRFGAPPTTSTYDCRPYLNGNNETCNIGSAQAGTYYVMLRGYRNFSGVSLVGSYTPVSSGSANLSTSINPR